MADLPRSLCGGMGTRLRHEIEDLGTLALALGLVPVVWWLLLGWRWPYCLAGHDELALALPRFASWLSLAKVGLRWSTGPTSSGACRAGILSGRFRSGRLWSVSGSLR